MTAIYGIPSAAQLWRSSGGVVSELLIAIFLGKAIPQRSQKGQ